MALNEPVANNLSLIDDMSIQQVAQTMQKITQFQKVYNRHCVRTMTMALCRARINQLC